MPQDTVSVETDGAIAVVRFDRGGRANALDFATMDALTAAARSFEGDTDTAVVVLAGADRNFSAGMDLRDPAFERLDELESAELRALQEHGPRMARAWAGIEAPTVCAIEGACLAGGLALAAMCDFRVASETARFGAPEVAVGLNMGWHSVPRLVALVGVQPTRRLLLLGEEWDAETARAFGFLDRLVLPGSAEAAALELAGTLAAQPAMPARMVKRQIEAAAHGGDWAVSAFDKDQQAFAWLSADFRRAIAAFGRG